MRRVKCLYQFDKDTCFDTSLWVCPSFLEPLHMHNCLEMGCCMAGNGEFYFSDKVYRVQPGDVFIVNNLEPHIMQSAAGNPGTFFFVFFSPLFIEEFDRELLTPFIYRPENFTNRIPAEAELAPALFSILTEIYEEVQKKDASYVSMVKSLLLQACTLVRRHYRGQYQGEDVEAIYTNYRRLKPVIEYIHDCCEEDIKLSDIAARLHMSESRARHFFKETLGAGFKEYLTALRIENAKRLLANTDEPINDIYFKCGFQSQAPFYRIFKKIAGISPAQYRERMQMEVINADED